MEFIFIVFIILIIYTRTFWHQNVTDDICVRSDYLNIFTQEKDDVTFYNKRRTVGTTLQCLSIFILSCYCIYIQFGFWPALLFAVYPLNVSGVAWKIGSYLYMTSTLLVLIAHYFVTHFGLVGLGIASVVYFTALHSGLNALAYAFIAPIVTGNPLTLILFIPLAFFLGGKRFRTGVKKREDLVTDHKTSAKFSFLRLLIVPKTVALYIALSIWPRLGFFTDFGYWCNNYNKDKVFYLSFILIGVYFIWGWQIDPKMIIWWFLSMGVFSQFKTLGMFMADRYMYLANVAFCILLSKFLGQWGDAPLIVLATLCFYRSWQGVQMWRNNHSLYAYSIKSFPYAPENHNNLSSWLSEHGDPVGAIRPLLVSLKLTPFNNHNIHCNLANLYGRVGEETKALMHIREAIKISPVSKLKKLQDFETVMENRIRDKREVMKILRRKNLA